MVGGVHTYIRWLAHNMDVLHICTLYFAILPMTYGSIWRHKPLQLMKKITMLYDDLRVRMLG